MSSHTTIRVNFGRPMPVFPLPVAVLMPHAIAPLEVFEPRYRQMISDALDGPGLIVMAVYAGRAGGSDDEERPAIRPAVCIGHIAEHFKYPDGRYAVIMQGICRGRIVNEVVGSEDRLYREAMIEPIGVETGDDEGGELQQYRDRLSRSLEDGPLHDLRLAKDAVRHLKNPEIPTSVIIEFLGANLPGATGSQRDADNEARYRWLAAADAGERAKIVTHRLAGLETLLRRAAPQRRVETPKGCAWN
jgi:Lon protease-like protein